MVSGCSDYISFVKKIGSLPYFAVMAGCHSELLVLLFSVSWRSLLFSFPLLLVFVHFFLILFLMINCLLLVCVVFCCVLLHVICCYTKFFSFFNTKADPLDLFGFSRNLTKIQNVSLSVSTLVTSGMILKRDFFFWKLKSDEEIRHGSIS
jgi:glucan phosphoethanolaminetransferase (alkaline phosphatase superfamily)